MDLQAMGKAARAAGRQLTKLNTAQKNAALLAIADEIEAQAGAILAENAKDIEAARAKGLEAYLLDRLLLTEARVAALAADTRQVATLPDPVGQDFESRVLPNGIRLAKRRMPIGVLGVIYEARPNVTIDVATLALKTGICSAGSTLSKRPTSRGGTVNWSPPPSGWTSKCPRSSIPSTTTAPSGYFRSFRTMISPCVNMGIP